MDSIIGENISFLRDAIVGKDKLYYITYENDQMVVKVRDLVTKQPNFLVAVDHARELVWVGENKLLVTANNRYLIVDITGASAPISGSADISYPTFDPESNTLYFLDAAAQPYAVPYFLSKLDISTGEETRIESSELILPPLLYDAKTKVLVSGGIKVLSTEGEVLHAIDVTKPSQYIFKR